MQFVKCVRFVLWFHWHLRSLSESEDTLDAGLATAPNVL